MKLRISSETRAESDKSTGIAKILYQIKESLIPIAAVTIAWIVLWKMNYYLSPRLVSNDFIYWIFLPSGLRLIAVLLVDFDAVIGLFIGRLITSEDLSDIPSAICISLISSIAPYVAYLIAKHKLDLKKSLTNMTGKQLFMMTLIFAFINSVLHNAYFYITKLEYDFWRDIFAMFIGEFTGSLLVIFICNALILLAIKNKAN